MYSKNVQQKSRKQIFGIKKAADSIEYGITAAKIIRIISLHTKIIIFHQISKVTKENKMFSKQGMIIISFENKRLEQYSDIMLFHLTLANCGFLY